MDQALRNQILFEIDFILKNQNYLNEDISDWASGKWKEFKDESSYLGKELGLTAKNLTQGDTSRLKQLGKAAQLGLDDIERLALEDPEALATNIIDVVSIFDPTGIADLINAGIYYKRKEMVPAVVSSLTGGLSLIGAIGSIAAGAGAPFILVSKLFKFAKQTKNLPKLIEICKSISKYGSSILGKVAQVVQKMPGLKPVQDMLSGLLKKITDVLNKSSSLTNFDEVFNYLFGSGPLESAAKIVDSQAFKETTKKVIERINKGAGVAMNISAAEESGAAIGEREEKEKKVRSSKICQNNSCNTIYYDKDSKEYVDSKTGKPDTFFNMAIAII